MYRQNLLQKRLLQLLQLWRSRKRWGSHGDTIISKESIMSEKAVMAYQGNPQHLESQCSFYWILLWHLKYSNWDSQAHPKGGSAVVVQQNTTLKPT
jgi:hypothetical protein